VSDSGVSEAVAGEAVSLAVIELGDFSGVATRPRYCVIVSRRRGSCEQVAVACETVADTGLHNLMDAAPQRYVALVLSLCGFESNGTFIPIKLIEAQAHDLIQSPACLPQQSNHVSRVTTNR